MYTLKTVSTIFRKNLILNISIIIMICISIFIIGMLAITIDNLDIATSLLEDYDMPAVYFSINRFNKGINLDDVIEVAENMDEIEFIIRTSKSVISTNINDEVNIIHANQLLFQSIPLPIKKGKNLIDNNDTNIINVLVSSNLGAKIGETIIDDFGNEYIVLGVLQDNVPVYSFNSYSTPTTTDTLFSWTETPFLLCYEMPEDIRFAMSENILFVFSDDISSSKLQEAKNTFSGYGNVATIAEMIENSNSEKKEILRNFSPLIFFALAISIASMICVLIVIVHNDIQTYAIMYIYGARKITLYKYIFLFLGFVIMAGALSAIFLLKLIMSIENDIIILNNHRIYYVVLIYVITAIGSSFYINKKINYDSINNTIRGA